MSWLQLCFSNLFRNNALGVYYRYLSKGQTKVNHLLTCFSPPKNTALTSYILHACMGNPKVGFCQTHIFIYSKVISCSHLKSLKLVSFSADPVYSFFFTVSPYLKSLSMVAANKLLHLLEVRACQFAFLCKGYLGLGTEVEFPKILCCLCYENENENATGNCPFLWSLINRLPSISNL